MTTTIKPFSANIRSLLECIGEDPDREGLRETPHRVIKSYKELFAGYEMDVKDVFKTFDGEEYQQIVLLKNIEMYSMCEHHMLPFFGEAHVAYIPSDNKRVIGASKLARILEVFARRLQIQERIGEQVTDALMKHLKPRGAACVISATHLCMRMRGVQKQNSAMITSSLKGVFLKDDTEGLAARNELMTLISSK